MPGRSADHGERLGRRALSAVGDEIREARLRAGLSQARVARHAGWTQTAVSRVERGVAPQAPLLKLARLSAVVGLDLSVRCFPGPAAVRDAGQVRVLTLLRKAVSPPWTWRSEVPVGPPGDQRAFDAVLTLGGSAVAVEAVTLLRDVQATLRAMRLKQQSAGVDRLILVLPATRGNRLAVKEAADLLRADLPVSPRVGLAALRRGSDPGGDLLLLVRSRPTSRGGEPPGTPRSGD